MKKTTGKASPFYKRDNDCLKGVSGTYVNEALLADNETFSDRTKKNMYRFDS